MRSSYSDALVVAADERVAALGVGDDRLARAALAELVQGKDVVGVVAELVPDQLLGLGRVRRHEVGSGAQRQLHRLALGVDHGRDAEPLQLA